MHSSSRSRPSKSRVRRLLVPAALVCAGFLTLCTWIFGASRFGSHPHVDAVDEFPVEQPGSTTPSRDQEPAAGQAPTAAVVADSQRSDDSETERIQKYLDSLYKRSDVVSSFRTKFGEDIDCIDFYAQPSVKALIARGKQVKIPHPAPPPPSSTPDPLADIEFNGQPDENGNPRQCPANAVPYIRKSIAQIRAAGGLKRYLRRYGSKPPVPPPNTAKDFLGFMHAFATYTATGAGGIGQPIFGGQSIASVYTPTIMAPDGGVSDGHSLSQTWTFTGSTSYSATLYAGQSAPASEVACTTGGGNSAACIQSVELGWIVSTGINGDAFPHLFIFSTQDGYWATGCYNTESCSTYLCQYDDDTNSPLNPCSSYIANAIPNPFILYPNGELTPGMALTTSPTPAAKPPLEIALSTNLVEGMWLVYEGTQLIGYWPEDTWNGAVYECTSATCVSGFTPGSNPVLTATTMTAGAPMATAAQTFQAGGEVAGAGGAFSINNPSPNEMGSGIGAPLGYEYSAYHRGIKVFLSNGLYDSNFPFSSIYATDLNCYNYGYGLANSEGNGVPQSVPLTGLGYTVLGSTQSSYTSANPGGSGWGNYLYYGGEGTFQGLPYTVTDPSPNQGFDACCTGLEQNGYGNDTQCAASQGTQ
jgi:hypothetical protein